MEACYIIKNEAKERLRGNWKWAIIVCLILSALPLIANIVVWRLTVSFVFTESLSDYITMFLKNDISPLMFWSSMGLYAAIRLINTVVSIALMTLTLSKTAFFIKIAENKSNGISDFIKEKRFFESFKTDLLVTVKVFLWALLFIIPGIIKAFSYAMTPYLKYKNKNHSVNDCIKESCRIMHGYKASFFFLNLSFIGWWILVGITSAIISDIPNIGVVLGDIVSFGAGAVISAYTATSAAVFYKELTYPYLGEKYGIGSGAAAAGQPNQNPFDGLNENGEAIRDNDGDKSGGKSNEAESSENKSNKDSVFESFDADRKEYGNTQSGGNDSYKKDGE